MILPSNLSMYLGAALALSVAGNAFLGWQWAESGAECETKIERKINASVARIGDASVKRDETSRDITKESDERADRASAQSDIAVQSDQGAIQDAYTKDPVDPSRDVDCTVLRPVPDRVQNVIESAVARSNR